MDSQPTKKDAPIPDDKSAAKIRAMLKAALTLEFLPFTILIILSLLSLISRIVLLLR